MQGQLPPLAVAMAATFILIFLLSAATTSVNVAAIGQTLVTGTWGDQVADGFIEDSVANDSELTDGYAKAAPKIPSRPSRTLVVASMTKEDMSWVQAELFDMIDAGDLAPAIYVVDDPSAPLHVPMNKGNEAMVYLTYVIDHYDELADISMFMHAHRFALHNGPMLQHDAVSMIRRLSPQRVLREGFVNMRCKWDVTCLRVSQTLTAFPHGFGFVAQAWSEIFPNTTVPVDLSTPCCAQIAVSRDQIRSYPREYYVRIRDWLIHTELTNFESGRVFEFAWQYIFTGHPAYCPSPDACLCDGYGICFGSEALLGDWTRLQTQQQQQGQMLRASLERLQELEMQREPEDRDTVVKSEEYMLEADKAAELQADVELLAQEIEDRFNQALARGAEPRERARAAGRHWQEGDGF